MTFDKMAKRLDLFDSQFGENRENARKKRPPSGLSVFYNNYDTKNKIMQRTNKITPVFDQ